MSRYYIVNLIFIIVLVISVSLDVRFEIPFAWYGSVVLAYAIINACGATFLSMEYFIPVRSRGEQTDVIAITFDDGPVAGKTEKILAILRKHNVRSSFFCIGHRVVENPELTNQIHVEGHLLGNHSFWHGRTFDLQTSGKIAKELADTDDALKKTVGVKPNFFRPPYGVTNPMVSRAVRKRNYTVVGWTVRSFDTMIKDPAKLLKRVTRSLQGGDIVLFHDYSDTMLEILPAFLEHVSGLGLKIVRIDELLNEKAYG